MKALEEMNKKELMQEAEALGLAPATRTKKADILALIQKTMAEDAEKIQAEIDKGKDPESPEKQPESPSPEDGEDPPAPEPTPEVKPAKKAKTKKQEREEAEAKIDPWKGPEWECKTPAAFIKSGLLEGIDPVAIGKGVAKLWPEYRGAGGPVASARVYRNRMTKSGHLAIAGGVASKTVKGQALLVEWKSGAEKAESPPTS